ncbi:MAG: hypothetical protein FJ298_09875 [Planctomycetes bacterium]|nr:hypothetical protein [Planctomycetota bacterium]
MSSRARVVVVGLEDGPECCAGPGLLACLEGRQRVALATRACESGAFRPGIAEEFALCPAEGSAPLEQGALALASKTRACVLVPGSAGVANSLAGTAARLARRGVRALVPTPAAVAALAPSQLALTCKRARVRSVWTREIPPDATAEQLLASSVWPLTLLGGLGLRRRAMDAMEALRHARSLRSLGASAVYASSPSPRALVECCVAITSEGKSLGSCSVRVLEDDERLRPWLAVTIEDERLERATLALARTARIRGPLLVTFVLTGGEPHVLDAQAAFPSWIEICLREGPNLPRLAVEAALGARMPRARRVPAGTLLSQVAHDVVVDPLGPAARAIFR